MEAASSKRVFIAINFPERVKTQVLNFQQQLNNKKLPINWIPVDRLHLTLVFLGNISNWDVKKLSGLADNIAEESSLFDLKINRIGFFKKKKRPDVVYLQVQGGRQLKLLQSRLAKAADAEGIGVVDSSTYKPHVTIGKFRQGEIEMKLFRRWKREQAQIEFPVTFFDIMWSDNSRSPIRYRVLHSSHFIEA